jgi:hypothetical protein
VIGEKRGATMRYLLGFFLSLAVSAVAIEAGAQGLDWRPYVNERFGYSVDIPAGLLYPLPPPENGDGLAFESADGQVSVSVFGSNNALEWSVDDYFRAALAREDLGRVTYQRKTEGWYVLSGYRPAPTPNWTGEVIFYERVAIDGGGSAISGLSILFPPSLKDFMDPIVTRMSRSLTPPVPIQ